LDYQTIMRNIKKVIRTCRYSWLLPGLGFGLTFAGGIGLSVSNQDLRMDTQIVGLVIFTLLAVIGVFYTVKAFYYFKICRVRACLYHALGGLLFNLVLALVTLRSVGAVYALHRHSRPAKVPSIEAFKPPPPYPSKQPLWIDTDPACGQGETEDVDDCWALIAALRSPELTIRGISTVFGNTTGEKAFQIARQAIERFGGSYNLDHRPPPVFEGSLSPGAPKWERTPASEAIAEALRREKLTLLAQGPLTNIATVLVNHPEVVGNIERIILIGGKYPGDLFHPGKQWWFHFRDFNICKDTPAAKRVLYSGVPLILIPFELATKVMITRSDLERLNSGDEAARWLRQVSESWMSFWENRLHRKGFHPFDALAIGYAAMPDLFTCEVRRARIGFSLFLEPFGMGRDLEVAPHIEGPEVFYCLEVDPGFKEIFLERLRGDMSG